MKKKSKKDQTIPSLRAEAEGRLAQSAGAFQANQEKNIEGLIHELQVHQIELEMQNEELREAQISLEESRDKYIDLYDFSPVGYFTFTREAVIKEVNLTGAELLGVERQKLINTRFRRFVAPEDHEKWDRHLISVFEPGGKQVCDLKLRRADGSLFAAGLDSMRIDGAGEAAAFRTAVSDIFERKEAEKAQRASSDRYRSYIEVTGQLGWTTDSGGEVVEDLPSWRKYTGQTCEEIKGWGWSKALHPDDLEHTAQVWKKALAAKSTYEVEYRIRRHDGIYRYFLARGVPVLKESGSIREWVGTCIDVTERKLIEEALRQSREDLSRAQEVGNIGSWRLDVRKNVLTWSEENSRIFGILKGTPLTYETFLAAVHPEDRAYVDTQWKAGLRGEPYDIEHRIVVDGLVKWVREQAYLECDKDGSLLGGFGITQDITKRKQAEEALRKAHYELERRSSELEIVNKELETFSYTISHDLKAPLRSIQGFAGAITEDYGDSLDEAGRDYLLRINSAGERMTQLIEAMMEISRLTSRELREKTVNLSSIAERIASELKQNGPARKVEFLIAKEVKAHGDSALMEIVLRNLLDNALKFTSKHASAKIEFGVMRMDGKNVYFVRDDGAGFDMGFAGKLFQPFQRFHAESEFSGLGIGLAIAWKIIVKHGGKIWAEAEIEKGATFFFTLG